MASVFQRVDDSGALLRVASTVVDGGKRVIGSVIPARDQDGQPHPVVAALNQGDHFFGQTHILGEAYIAAYEPLMDGNRVIGAIGVAVEQEKIDAAASR